MYTANEILSKVNEYINNLTYDRKPQSLYEPIKSSSHWEGSASVLR